MSQPILITSGDHRADHLRPRPRACRRHGWLRRPRGHPCHQEKKSESLLFLGEISISRERIYTYVCADVMSLSSNFTQILLQRFPDGQVPEEPRGTQALHRDLRLSRGPPPVPGTLVPRRWAPHPFHEARGCRGHDLRLLSQVPHALQRQQVSQDEGFAYCYCLCCTGVVQVTSTFWAVTQSFLRAEQAIISHLKGGSHNFHMTPKFTKIYLI